MNQQIKQRIEQINNSHVPEGYKKTEFGIFPCDWVTDKTLDKVCQINPKTNCLPKQFIYLDLESVQDRKIIQKNIINIENAPSRAQRVLSKDDIIYQLVRPYQKNNLFFNVDDEQYPTVASTGYGLLRSKMQNYLFQIIHADYFVNQVNVKCTGTNYPAINSDDLGKVLIAFPQSKNEQDKIAEILMKWDEAIVLYNRQIEKLKQLKSVCIKKMFPKKRSKVPEVRFKGFTKDWEQRKLGELSSLITKGTTPLDKSNMGTVNFVKIESIDNSSGEITITQKITSEEHEGYLRRSQLKENDILFSIAGTLGRVTSVKSSILPANTNQALAIIRLKSGCLKYVKTYLKGKAVADFIKKNPTIGAQPNLSLEQVSNLEIALPSDIEQEQIGSFFENLDNLITLHQRKVEKIKIQQKALQQYLLNGIVRVNV